MKIGAKVVAHGRYVTFQLAEVAVPSNLFREILRRIEGIAAKTRSNVGRGNPRQGTTRWERCVWVTKNWTKWASEYGQITKIGLSRGCCVGGAGFLISPLAKSDRKARSRHER